MIYETPNPPLAELLCAHIVGDLILQNHWMQRKSQSSLVCAAHVLIYMLPFGLIQWCAPVGLSNTAYFAIAAQYFLQDRFQLHLKWMKLFEQSPPDKWPIGPFVVDQAWHIAFIWFVWRFIA